jgi:carbon storage regulator
MFVLSRKRNESIVINNDIIITVVDIRGNKVRLGIEAPELKQTPHDETGDTTQRESEQP